MPRLTPRWIIGGAAMLFLAALALFWPGVAMYDSVAQYRQVLSGVYDDWHPPAMARAWALLGTLAPGAGPMLVAQLAAYWAGLELIAAALATTGRRRGAVAILAIGVLPPFLGWQGVVLKDAQLVGATLAATGVIGWWRLRGRAVPRGIWLIGAVLLGYAVLVRANAVFALAPLVAMLLPGSTRPVTRLAVLVGATIGVLLLSPVVNHGLFGAQRSGVERTQALYDLAGIAARSGPGALTEQEAKSVVDRHCVSPFFWDPLGDDAHCGVVMARLRAMPVGALYVLLARGVIAHPVAYAGHRLAHLNSTERWIVPARWPGAAPPAQSEPNDIGLASPGPAARGWQAVTGLLVETPLGWPIAWVVIAVTALAAGAGAPRTDAGALARALLVSALCAEASFGVLSIASDLRYHLWPMIATAVAVVLLADQPRPIAARRVIVAGAGVLLVVTATGIASRMLLPTPPQSYAAMLG